MPPWHTASSVLIVFFFFFVGAGMNTSLQKLEAARNAAFSAWQAVPERQKAAKAAAEAVLSAASRALTSAKKAEKESAEKAVVTPVTREVTERDLIPLYKAVAAFDAAQAYPRCGEGWGDYPGEQGHIDVAVSMCKRGSKYLPLINRLARNGEICSTTLIELCGEEALA